MTAQEFIKGLNTMGVDWASAIGGRIIIPCPLTNHNLPYGKRANVFMGESTGFGKCDYCGKGMRFEEVLAALSGSEYVLAVEQQKIVVAPQNDLTPPPSGVLSIADILDMQFPADEWLVENFIPLPSVTALSGVPGDFKTWLTEYLALCVARGTNVFGKLRSVQAPVLIIDEEMHTKHLQKRFQSLGFARQDAIKVRSLQGFKVDDPKQLNELIAFIKRDQIKFVIIDSLIRVHGQEENDAKGMAKVMDCFKAIAKENVAVLFTHHHRKQAEWKPANSAQSLRGSSDILAGIDSLFMLAKKKDEDVLILRQAKARHSEAMEPLEVSIIKNNGSVTGFGYLGKHDEKKIKSVEAAEAIGKLISIDTMSRAQIIENLKGSFGEKAIDEGLGIAVNEKLVELVPKAKRPAGTKGDYYRATGKIQLTEPESAPSQSPTLINECAIATAPLPAL